MFKGKKGQILARDMGKRATKTFVPGAALPSKGSGPPGPPSGAGASGPTTVPTTAAPPARPDTEAIKVS